MNRWTRHLLWNSLLTIGLLAISTQSQVVFAESGGSEPTEMIEEIVSETKLEEGLAEQVEGEIVVREGVEEDADNDEMASPLKLPDTEETSKRYDILYEENGHFYYYEPEFYGGILARNKWSYSPSNASWYFSDANGWVSQMASRTSYVRNGVQETDVVVTINDNQLYYEPTMWGGQQARNKWSYSPSQTTWYHSDVNGWINQVASRSSYTSNGVRETDTVVTINGYQLYYEPAAWGGQQARNKWSYSPSQTTWYHSDVNGWINQVASRSSYTSNGVRETDTVVTINGYQLYYEPAAWGGQQARNKWSYSPSQTTWYYSDVNGWINQVASRSSYISNGVRETDVVVSINGDQFYYEPLAWGGHQARGKWSYSPNASLWYYSDRGGVIIQAIKEREPYDVKVIGIDDMLYLGKDLSVAKVEKAQILFGQKFNIGQTIRHGSEYLVELKKGTNTIGYIPSQAVVNVPKDKRTIYLDSGHGGSELGAFKFGVAEKDLNLQITVPLAKRLRELGYIVYESRTTDKEIPLRQRQIEPNQLMPDIYVSIHHNAMPESYGGRAKGILSLYHDRSVDEPGYMTMPYHPESKFTEGKRLAITIQRALETETNAPTQGTRAQNLHVTRTTDVPAALIELGFMDNWEEFQRLTNLNYQQKLISGLIKGINMYFANLSN